MTSELSSRVKRYSRDPNQLKQVFAEMNVLTGYLQNYIEPVDWVDELKKLAQGGDEHGLINTNWHNELKDALVKTTAPITRVLYISLRDYIDQGLWVTSGSSSVGTVKWERLGTSGKFKARKNMLTFIYTTDELLDIVLNWDGKLQSVAFTKDELSKRRIAVASNLAAYLSESYMLHHLGHPYKNWPYMTLDESPAKQHNRNMDMIKHLENGQWALPFDFKAFDHQPTTTEIQIIVQGYIDLIHMPPENEEWKLITTNVLNSYANSEITMTKDAVTTKVAVTGGLPSGVRLTSLLGNQWNAAMTQIVKDRVTRMVGYDPTTTIGIKGDDTYIISSNPAALYLFRLGYEAINAVGLDSKFGIMPMGCEFLRNEIGVDGVRGWANRTIPTLTQRKPWNPQPWSPSSDVSTVAMNIYTLERRLRREVTMLHTVNKIKWGKYTNQSYRWLELPVRLGGFGIYPFSGYLPNRSLPKVKRQPAKYSPLNINTPNLPKWITLNDTQKQSYQQLAMDQLTSADDIPGVQTYHSRAYIEELRVHKVLWEKKPIYVDLNVPRTAICPGAETNTVWPHSKLDIERNAIHDITYLQFAREYSIVSQLAELPSLRKMSETFFPATTTIMLEYERRGWHRTDAINLTIGAIPTEPIRVIHPQLTPFVQESLVKAGIHFWRGRRMIASNIYNATASAILSMAQNVNSIYFSY